VQLELLNHLAHFQLVILDLENDVAFTQSRKDSIEEELGVSPFIEKVILDIFFFDLFQQHLSRILNVLFKVLFLIDSLADDEMGMHEVDRDVSFTNTTNFISFLVIFLLLGSGLRV
jgi:hypothetical protein